MRPRAPVAVGWVVAILAFELAMAANPFSIQAGDNGLDEGDAPPTFLGIGEGFLGDASFER